jgi:sugar phosphate permease
MPALFFLYEFMIRVMPAVIEKPLQEQLGVTAGQIGLSMSFYYYAYGPMQLVVGVLLDKYGARSPLAVASLACALGIVAFAMAGSLTGLATGRFLMGFGSAFAYVGTVYIATIWFPGRRVALISGITISLGMLGAITAESTLQFLVNETPWQNVMYGFAGAGVLLSILLWVLIPNRPAWFHEHIQESHASHGQKHPGIIACVKQVFTNRQTLLLGLITGLVYLPLGTFAALWGFRYLNTVLHIKQEASGAIVSMIFVGLAIGSPLIGWISDTLGRRKPLLMIGTIMGVIATSSLLLLQPGHPVFLLINLFVMGVVVGVLVLAFPMAMDQNPCYARGTALTFVNLTQMLFAGIGQWVVGLLLDMESANGVAANSKEASDQVFSSGDFRGAFILLPIAMLVAFFLTIFLKEPVTSHSSSPS